MCYIYTVLVPGGAHKEAYQKVKGNTPGSVCALIVRRHKNKLYKSQILTLNLLKCTALMKLVLKYTALIKLVYLGPTLARMKYIAYVPYNVSEYYNWLVKLNISE